MSHKCMVASLQELKQGWMFDEGAGTYSCLFCGEIFYRGRIYPIDDALMDAGTAVNIHIRRSHGSAFESLLKIEKKLNGLTDLQRELMARFYHGESDQEIAEALGSGSVSTIRNHRHGLRERKKQARIFLAIMELLEEQLAEQKSASAKTGRHGEPLRAMPRKMKQRVAVLGEAAERFEKGRLYSEDEVNRVLEGVCEDYAGLRRNLVDFAFLEQDAEGGSYWLKNWNELETMEMNRKTLKQQYKNSAKPAGVFQIKCQATGKVLVGGSPNLDARRNRFAFELQTGNFAGNREMQEDWRKHGADSFSFEVLEQLPPHDDPPMIFAMK